MNDDIKNKPEDTLNNLLYEFMSRADRLSELSRLVGKLRFASEQWEGFYDKAMIEEVEAEILLLSTYLPDNYRIMEVVQSAKLWNDSGSVLTQLYLDRCQKLHENNYVEVQQIEEKIRWIESFLDQFR